MADFDAYYDESLRQLAAMVELGMQDASPASPAPPAALALDKSRDLLRDLLGSAQVSAATPGVVQQRLSAAVGALRESMEDEAALVRLPNASVVHLSREYSAREARERAQVHTPVRAADAPAESAAAAAAGRTAAVLYGGGGGGVSGGAAAGEGYAPRGETADLSASAASYVAPSLPMSYYEHPVFHPTGQVHFETDSAAGDAAVHALPPQQMPPQAAQAAQAAQRPVASIAADLARSRAAREQLRSRLEQIRAGQADADMMGQLETSLDRWQDNLDQAVQRSVLLLQQSSLRERDQRRY